MRPTVSHFLGHRAIREGKEGSGGIERKQYKAKFALPGPGKNSFVIEM